MGCRAGRVQSMKSWAPWLGMMFSTSGSTSACSFSLRSSASSGGNTCGRECLPFIS